MFGVPTEGLEPPMRLQIKGQPPAPFQGSGDCALPYRLGSDVPPLQGSDLLLNFTQGFTLGYSLPPFRGSGGCALPYRLGIGVPPLLETIGKPGSHPRNNST